MKACLVICGDSRLPRFQIEYLAANAGFLTGAEEVYVMAVPGGAASTSPQHRADMQLYCSLPSVDTLLLVIHEDCKAFPHPELREEGLQKNIEWARQHLPSVTVRAFVVDPHTMTFSERKLE